jgi:hypothetical protein
VLDQDDRRRHAVRQRLPEPEGIVVVEEVAVGELGRARNSAAVGTLRPTGSEADERPQVLAERDRLLPVEVRRLHDRDVALLVLPDEEQVEDPDHVLGLEAVELREDLALEAVAVEADGEHLDRADPAHRSRT